MKDGERFRLESLVVKRVVVAMDDEEKMFAFRQSDPPLSLPAVRHRFKSVARFVAQNGRFAFLHGEKKLVDRVIQLEQGKIWL